MNVCQLPRQLKSLLHPPSSPLTTSAIPLFLSCLLLLLLLDNFSSSSSVPFLQNFSKDLRVYFSASVIHLHCLSSTSLSPSSSRRPHILCRLQFLCFLMDICLHILFSLSFSLSSSIPVFLYSNSGDCLLKLHKVLVLSFIVLETSLHHFGSSSNLFSSSPSSLNLWWMFVKAPNSCGLPLLLHPLFIISSICLFLPPPSLFLPLVFHPSLFVSRWMFQDFPTSCCSVMF